MDHYRTPQSDVEPPGVRRSYVGQVAALLVYVIAILATSWFALPPVNSAVASQFFPIGTDPYWTTRYAVDTFGTGLVFAVGTFVAIRRIRLNRFVVAIAIGTAGLSAFLMELGGLGCLGACGPPLWYDLLAFVKHIGPAFLVAVFFGVVAGKDR